MFPYDDKRFVYYLIEKYLKNQLTEKQFCDEFRLSFDLELDLTMLDSFEYDAMHYLGIVAGRFSTYDEDHMNSPGALFTKEELHSKIVETKQKLMTIHPEYFEERH